MTERDSKMKKRIIALAALIFILFENISLAACVEANPDTSDWFVYEYPSAEDVEGTVLDASILLDAPAGKHGFLNRTEGDNFYFEDGTEGRFWGVNLTSDACYGTYESSKETAKRIAQAGFNLARLHLVDSGAGDGIWKHKADGGRVMDTKVLDRMCFLVSELKKRGIYIMMDLVISTPVVSDMDFDDLEALSSGLKMYSYFDEKLIAFQKKYADELLSYHNKYTGLALKDDPAMVLIDIKNEDSISDLPSIESEHYNKIIQAKFNEWLVGKYKTRDALVSAWYQDSSRTGLRDEEDPVAGTVEIYSSVSPSKAFSDPRQIDRRKFLAEVEENFFSDRIADMRELGVKCMITGSTAWSMYGTPRSIFYSNRNTDFVDTHNYQSHTNTNAYTDGTIRNHVPTSILQTDGRNRMLTDMWMTNFFNKPHTISEWNDLAPNKYRTESLLMVSAYSAMQGMHPVAFAWQNLEDKDTPLTTETFKKRCFDMANTPEYTAAFPTVSRIFLRGDVSEAQSGYYPIRLQDDEIFSPMVQYMNLTSWRPLNPYFGYVGKTGMSMDGFYDEEYNDNTVLQLTKNAYENGTPYVSVTDELSMDFTNKMFLMNTEKSQAASGFFEGKTVELDDVVFDVDNYFATLYLSSVDDKEIYNSERLLLTVTGDTRNTGMVLSEDEATIIEAGSAPVLVEPITGTVTVKTDKPINVYALSTSGQRKSTVLVSKSDEGYSFIMDASDKTMHYEIIKSATEPNAHISLGNTAPSDVFDDVAQGHKNKEAIENMALHDYIGALSGNNFSPDTTITRKDFIKMLVRALHLEETVWYDSNGSYFSDLANTDDGFGELAIAYRVGAVERESVWWWNYIRPETEVTRGAAMVHAAKLLEGGFRTQQPASDFSLSNYSDYSSDDSNSQYYHTIMGLGYLDAKDGKIAASQPLTRAEAAEMVYRIAWK